MNLIVKLLIGMISGLAIGQWMPDVVIRVFITFESLFGSFLNFIIPFIIIFFIISGIAALKSNSGRTLSTTVALAYISSVLAGLFAVAMGLLAVDLYAQPDLAVQHDTFEKLKPFFTLELKPVMDVISALLVAFMFGIGINVLQNDSLKKLADGGTDITEMTIRKIIIPLLPLYICSVFANIASEGAVFYTLKTYGFVLLLAVALHWLYLIGLYLAAGALSQTNPFKALKAMLPAYFTAIGTMSSSATIPVALKQTKLYLKNSAVADFTVPLCATIHLAGSTITLISCAIAVMVLNQIAVPSMGLLLPFVLMLAVTMVAAPGVPGGGVMAALGILGSMLGFPEEALGLMIALYIAQDSFGTGCNVTGDGAIAMIVDRFCHKDEKPAPPQILSE